MIAVAKRALFAMQRQCRSEEITAYPIMCRMFDTLVAPILLYGCEVWGSDAVLVEEANKVHMGFLKYMLRAPTSTDGWIVLTEMGRTPMAHRILERQCAFWNRLGQVSGARLLTYAARENFAWLCAGRKGGWFSSTMKLLNEAGLDLSVQSIWSSGMIAPYEELKNMLKGAGSAALRTSMSDGILDHRDLYGSSLFSRAGGNRRRSYATWFWQQAGSQITSISNTPLRHSLQLFRLGVHKLNIIMGARGSGGSTPREHRFCKCCSMGVVEDEVHLIFECPKYQIIRMGFSDLFRSFVIGEHGTIALIDTDDMMRNFFAQEHQMDVAKFIRCCMLEREAFCG